MPRRIMPCQRPGGGIPSKRPLRKAPALRRSFGVYKGSLSAYRRHRRTKMARRRFVQCIPSAPPQCRTIPEGLPVCPAQRPFLFLNHKALLYQAWNILSVQLLRSIQGVYRIPPVRQGQGCAVQYCAVKPFAVVMQLQFKIRRMALH